MGIAGLIANVLQAYIILIMVPTALLSWFRINPNSGLGQVQRFLFRATEPVLRPVRQVVKPVANLDLSFLVVLIVAEIAISVLGGATIL